MSLFINNLAVFRHQQEVKWVKTVLALREVWESEAPKNALGLPKFNARKSGTPNF